MRPAPTALRRKIALKIKCRLNISRFRRHFSNWTDASGATARTG
ncbi:ATP-dependent RNA helicase RhlE domain protein [Neisseria meningitidis 992008]|nr:ATP-dependent RNA helicase RhlE domain protein [Neisseria meningitidis 992008]KER39400.1 ATP-dependent RNA helicase RhlE domain protein [Neisseria meningitidis 992008]